MVFASMMIDVTPSLGFKIELYYLFFIHSKLTHTELFLQRWASAFSHFYKIVIQKTYFMNHKSNLIMNCKIHYQCKYEIIN